MEIRKREEYTRISRTYKVWICERGLRELYVRERGRRFEGMLRDELGFLGNGRRRGTTSGRERRKKKKKIKTSKKFWVKFRVNEVFRKDLEVEPRLIS